MKKVIKKILLLLGLGALVFFIWLPTDNYTTYSIRFVSNQDTLSGVINMPHEVSKDSLTLLIFVHGDGALPANAYGYYEPIWRHLAAKGVATLAWDKKGVGASQGNWLAQDMEERAQEIRDVLKHIRASKQWRFSKIGVIGFSQGGWVLPRLDSAQLSCMIIVSGAVNWMQQSNYLTTQRLKREGKSVQEIAQGLAQNEADHQFLLQNKSYQYYVAYERKKLTANDTNLRVMSKERYYFVQKNIQADATQGLQRIKCPVFAIFGDKDLNVNHRESAKVYRDIFRKYHPRPYTIKTYSNATHGLLKHRNFQKINPDAAFMWKFWLWGQSAFVPNVLDDISTFVLRLKVLPI
jgi:pimeloyl-ACP methyl ester carboxylesterase